ncbi:MAG TPA: DUF3006 domain-containing protein, partial [Metabacillus sp.]|nr:DUF3006 domain-containing protein [Metabacillus sp.]
VGQGDRFLVPKKRSVLVGRKICTIDRFEKEWAVLLLREDETVLVDVLRSEVPEGLEIGSLLEAELDSKGHVLFCRVLEEETEIVRQNARKKRLCRRSEVRIYVTQKNFFTVKGCPIMRQSLILFL